MIDEKQMIEVMKKKANYFYKKKIPIHVSLKTEKWLNGKIKEIGSDFFIIEDFVEGEYVVFLMEILPNGLEKYKKKEKKNGRKNK